MEQENLIELFNRLTLEEKIAQLLQVYGGFLASDAKEVYTGPLENLGINETYLKNAGSVLNSVGAAQVIQIQDTVMASSTHKIPLVFTADICNGYKTIFPAPIGQGASWDPELVEKCCEVAAREATSAGVMITYSPMVDVCRDPRWGRVIESPGGEDPYLGGIFAAAYVKGYQGGGIEIDKERMGACVKHFAAYGAAEAGRDYNTVDMSERTLRQYYLPPYKAAIDAGCEMVMTSFNIFNGVPASGNTFMMRDVLRKEWMFNGLLVSDYAAIAEMVEHGVAKDLYEAAKKGIYAGVDIDMMTGAYTGNLRKLVEDEKVDVNLINQSVMRLLELKNKLGLFEDPYRGACPEKEQAVCLSPEHRKVARKMVAKSCVLLKNENDILPLSKDVKKIALIGPFSGSPDISGSWSLFSENDTTITIYQGLKAKVPNADIVSALGCMSPDEAVARACGQFVEPEGYGNIDPEEAIVHAIEVAKSADVVVLAIGESNNQSGEGGSCAFIDLTSEQQRLVDEISKLKKKTVALLFSGRPMDIRILNEKVDSILAVWFPGIEGGNGIADILFGDENPSGRLTMSFPYSVGQCPVYYNHFRTGRPNNNTRYSSRYLDAPNEPLFSFGYGLSYSKFEYSNITLDKNTMTKESKIKVSVQITNISDVAGDETVQLYIRDMVASVVRPVKELKEFKKLHFEAGETQTVIFCISEEMLRFWNIDMQYISEKGSFKVFIGKNSVECLEADFELL